MIRSQKAMNTLRRMVTKIEVDTRERAGFESASLIINEAIRMIERGSKSGRFVSESASGRPSGESFRRSAPLEAPATETGDLIKSIEVAKESIGGSSVWVAKAGGSVAPHALDLELGNPSENLLPRPFMRPAAIDKQDEIRDEAVKAINNALRLS